MSCRWSLNNNGEIEGAYTKDGEKSKLFDNLNKKFGLEKAVEMYAVSQSDNFKEAIEEDEPNSETVVRYIAQQNKTQEKLTSRQTIDLQDFETFDKQKLEEVFYDENGLFFVNADKLVKSGLYDQYEAQSIFKDTELQNRIKDSVERLKNTEYTTLSEDFIKREVTSEFNSFGKLKKLNPAIVESTLKEELVGVENKNEFLARLAEIEYQNVDANKLFEELKDYKKADEFVEVEGEIRQKNKTETELILPIVAKLTSNVKAGELLNFNLGFLQRNEEITRDLLNEIEDEMANDGIDVIGLSEANIDENLINLISSLNSFINSPTKENTRQFTEVSDEFFKRDLTPQTKIVKGEQNKEYAVLDTTLNEEEVYSQSGLIKTGEKNLWIQTNKEDLTVLYEALRTYTEKYPKDKTLEEYVQEQIAEMDDFTNTENAEAVLLYKMYFGIDNNKQTAELNIKSTHNFRGDYSYLTNEFVSDFYSDFLAEKKKNSKIFKNFYSNFTFNEKGISLINEDAQTVENIKLQASEELKQYSLLSKQLSDLTTDLNNEGIENGRDSALNNPENVEKLKGQLYKLNENEVIVKNNPQGFVKIGDEIYESVAKSGDLNHFVKIGKNNSEYNVIGVLAPQTEVNLNDYKYLEKSTDEFTTVKKYLAKAESEKLAEFNC